jgi:hypothetical protein
MQSGVWGKSWVVAVDKINAEQPVRDSMKCSRIRCRENCITQFSDLQCIHDDSVMKITGVQVITKNVV